jgi:hypothetical protein
MLNLQELLAKWGFTEHPFAEYTAEREERLADYFVAPPYFEDVAMQVSPKLCRTVTAE